MRLIMRGFLFGSLAVAICNAQHYGGHGAVSGGFHAGTSGIRTGSPGLGFSSGFGGRNSLPPPASGISPFAWRQIQRSNRFGNGNFGYGGFFAPYYYPSLGYGDNGFAGNGYDAPPPEDPSVQNMSAAEGVLSKQVQILSDQIDQLKNAQQRGAMPQDDGAQDTTPQVPITLVLRNGQQIQVQNYAVMDQTFWDFTRQPARKIPVSSIDIAASTRATEAKGAEFPQISTP